MNATKRLLKNHLALLLLLSAVLCGGCTHVAYRRDAPPILTQEELLRPYQKVGTIEVHRVRYGAREDLTPADYNWANDALRAEAAKIGADAVILPEVKVEMDTFIFFPKSEMTARGTAIKFR
ncbi:hypothetical protein KP001_11445 [Geomonas subterranea]|uniref:Lipoprotein n=1 Tax=Geomonas subterranea TaxID=2847989 RepID=A0ABX8LCN2_9BACT|nr:hypothetical protein [Geomonas subterranea]QXE89081.1 hypothetical protein KP001_11445 [Geomonas subterranea]QXM08801.1 hypothetical protein KP002_17830 [Geomonas subterranea]